ncbi:MAG: hypothetical protein M3065_02540 [Actinomycetota bacterium]|nr:hypothetical protein [Actinomycetota bacterium]
MADVGAWLLAVCGLGVVGIGVFFVAFRPPLLPEDRRYMAAQQEPLDAVLPALARWLEKVFWVMGGYMVATGVLTIHLALSGVRDGSATAWVVAGAAGVASVGLMAVVNVLLRSDFRWPLLGLALLWTAAALLAALGV